MQTIENKVLVSVAQLVERQTVDSFWPPDSLWIQQDSLAKPRGFRRNLQTRRKPNQGNNSGLGFTIRARTGRAMVKKFRLDNTNAKAEHRQPRK